jgi:integrase
MMSTRFYLYKRSNGIWYAGYVEDGRRRWKSTGKNLRTEAHVVLRELEKHFKPKVPTLLFTPFVSEFCSLKAGSLRPSTIDRIYRQAFNSFKAACGNKPLVAYTVREVEHFKSSRLATCAPTTVNIEFRTLRAAFNEAVKWGYLQENPFLKSHCVRVPKRMPIYFTIEQFKEFIDAVNVPVLRDLFMFAALTGMRQGEILNLKWSQVDMDRRLVFVTNSENFQTKTGDCRVVPMNDFVFNLLNRRHVLRGFYEYAFHLDGHRLTQSYVEHRFKRHLRARGLPDELKFHSLRHTFATWLVQNGASLYEVQKLLGHSDSRTTQIYSHLVASELHNAVNRISLPLH